MPDKPLTAKQQCFVQSYADPGSKTYNNIEQSMLKAGYAESYARHSSKEMLSNIVIYNANVAYRARVAVELGHNREIAVKLLSENLTHLTERVGNGDVGAISARTAVIRELNAISNLHSSTVHTEAEHPDELTPAQAELYRTMAQAALADKLKRPKLSKEAV